MNSFSWLTTRILDSAESSIKTLVSNMVIAAPTYEDSGGDDEEAPVQLGITPELVEFVINICSHPNTFKDFPTEQLPSSTKLTPKQEKHAMFILKLVPELSQLRYKLCPVYMRDDVFWCVYFLLVFNKTGNILTLSPLTQGPPSSSSSSSSSDADTRGTPTKQQSATTITSSSTPAKQQPNQHHQHHHHHYHQSQTAQDVEDYFDKLLLSQMAMAEVNNSNDNNDNNDNNYSSNNNNNNNRVVDDGIEPDDDNYFSPHKYKYNTASRGINLSSSGDIVTT